MLRPAVLLVFLIATPALAQTTRNNDDSCDIGVAPAATLLLPYFEVDIASPPHQARTTLFSITNVTHDPHIAHVTLWTDWAYPVLTFNVFLTGYDVQSINLYDVLVLGRIAPTSNATPPGPFSLNGNPNFRAGAAGNCSPASMPSTIPRATIADLQSALTTGVYLSCGTSRIGGTHASAIGYATIDLVADCTTTLPIRPEYHTDELLYDNVLIGDFQIVHPHPAYGNQALGEPMVHIRAIPEGGKAGSLADTDLPYTFYDRYTPSSHRRVDRRQPLPSAFAARYIQGGSTGFLTNFHIWREGVTGANAACSSYISNRSILIGESVRFDERENSTIVVPQIICTCAPPHPTLPAAVSLPSWSTLLPPLTSGDVAGWMYLNLHGDTTNVGAALERKRASQNWVVSAMEAEGRYATASAAVPLGNGCSPRVAAPTAPISTGANPIGPRP